MKDRVKTRGFQLIWAWNPCEFHGDGGEIQLDLIWLNYRSDRLKKNSEDDDLTSRKKGFKQLNWGFSLLLLLILLCECEWCQMSRELRWKTTQNQYWGKYSIWGNWLYKHMDLNFDLTNPKKNVKRCEAVWDKTFQWSRSHSTPLGHPYLAHPQHRGFQCPAHPKLPVDRLGITVRRFQWWLCNYLDPQFQPETYNTWWFLQFQPFGM
jgi:hypothetical protein